MEVREALAIFFGILAGIINILVCRHMVRAENTLIVRGEIPWRGIQHLKDYQFFMKGDRFCLTVMDFCILYVLVQVWPLHIWAVILSACFAFFWATKWHRIWLGPSHRPDVFYPSSGVVSYLGEIHYVYFFVQYALGFMGLCMVGYMIVGLRPWSWVAVLGLASAAVYYMILALDLLRGKFKRLPTQRG